MKKFFKIIVFFSLSIGVVIAAYGYYKGFTFHDVVSYVKENILDKKKNVKLETDPKKSFSNEKKVKNKSTSERKEESRIVFEELPKNVFLKIDNWARKAPKPVEISIDKLAEYLEKGANNDLEKSRAIYIWLTENISYDDLGYNTGNYNDTDAESVLKNKRSVCSGYSNLFFELGKRMGLNIRKVKGYAKGYGYKPGSHFSKTNHAWNMVKIDGKWKVFDATWGRGFGKNIKGKLVSSKEFDDYWFNVDPYEAIFSHLPEDTKLANVVPAINLKTYEAIYKISNDYFRLGFEGRSTYKKYRNKRTLSFPKCYNIDTYVKMNKAHKYNILSVGNSYEFEFFVPRGIEMAIISSDNTWSYFDKEKGVFKIICNPTISGELKVSCKHEKGGGSFHTVMEYKVIDKRPSA